MTCCENPMLLRSSLSAIFLIVVEVVLNDRDARIVVMLANGITCDGMSITMTQNSNVTTNRLMGAILEFMAIVDLSLSGRFYYSGETNFRIEIGRAHV